MQSQAMTPYFSLYAETADHAQCDAQASDALADGTASARLTVKTVADPQSAFICRLELLVGRHGLSNLLAKVTDGVVKTFQLPNVNCFIQ